MSFQKPNTKTKPLLMITEDKRDPPLKILNLERSDSLTITRTRVCSEDHTRSNQKHICLHRVENTKYGRIIQQQQHMSLKK